MTNFGSIVFIMEDAQPLVPLYGTGFLNNEFPFQKFFFCATKRDLSLNVQQNTKLKANKSTKEVTEYCNFLYHFQNE